MPVLTAKERVGTLVAQRYRLTRLIGKGGMGVVFEGRHEWTRRRVAIKLLRPHLLEQDPSLADRFLDEAQATAALKHPNVVEVLDMGQDHDGSLFIAMEYLEGQSLGDVIAARKPTYDELRAWLPPVMNALERAHQAGVIHRDVKPDNIFLTHTENGVVPKLLDFGVVKMLGGVKRTETGLVMGTPAYMSPEQAAGEALTPHLDIWAFGCVIYEAIACRPAFGGTSSMEVMAAIVRVKYRPLREVAPETPARLASVVNKALAKKLSDRFNAIGELRDAFVDACPRRPARTVKLKRKRPWRKRPEIFVPTLLIAAAALGALGYFAARMLRSLLPG